MRRRGDVPEANGVVGSAGDQGAAVREIAVVPKRWPGPAVLWVKAVARRASFALALVTAG